VNEFANNNQLAGYNTYTVDRTFMQKAKPSLTDDPNKRLHHKKLKT